MSKQIGSIAIFADMGINMYTGREYIDHASIQFWEGDEDSLFSERILVRNTGLSAVVTTEQDLWEHVERSVQDIIDEGYEIDEPEVRVYRTHKTSLKLDYFEAIGRHI